MTDKVPNRDELVDIVRKHYVRWIQDQKIWMLKPFPEYLVDEVLLPLLVSNTMQVLREVSFTQDESNDEVSS